MHLFTSLVASMIDAAFGYPRWLYERIGHPASWIGRLIAWCEERWNRPGLSFARRRLNGLASLLIVLSVTAAVAIAIQQAVNAILPAPFNLLILGAAASTLVAQRSLHDHVAAVAEALESRGIEAGRRAVGMIVGRDTTALDESAVSRAAIESLAENYSDGVVAPLFWMLLGGLPGAALYKAINTADSMIGHKTDRYHAFGWAAARLDDLVNLPASRLATLLLTSASAVLPAFSPGGAIEAVTRDARHHRSPNAGWPEAAMAGALNVRLAGPRSYGGTLIDDAFMGSGRSDLTPADIRRALQLFRCACFIQALAIAAAALVTLFLF
jgi:adenosylcobinamide-phosphate synthase